MGLTLRQNKYGDNRLVVFMIAFAAVAGREGLRYKAQCRTTLALLHECKGSSPWSPGISGSVYRCIGTVAAAVWHRILLLLAQVFVHLGGYPFRPKMHILFDGQFLMWEFRYYDTHQLQLSRSY